MNMDICLKEGSQLRFRDKSYYRIKSLMTGRYIYLDNEVGVEKGGIFSEDLKKLIVSGAIEVLNLGLKSNGDFYERSISKTNLAKECNKDIGLICYKIGSEVMKMNQSIKCKYAELKLEKTDNPYIIAKGVLDFNGIYRLYLYKDVYGKYYLYDDMFLIYEGIQSRNAILKEMKNAVNMNVFNA